MWTHPGCYLMASDIHTHSDFPNVHPEKEEDLFCHRDTEKCTNLFSVLGIEKLRGLLLKFIKKADELLGLSVIQIQGRRDFAF